MRETPLRTIMFTDLVDSSGIKIRAGDEKFFAELQKHYALVRKIGAKHRGTEVKTVGDSFVYSFDDPHHGVDCAVEIQRRHEKSPIVAEGEPLRVRIGLHTGTPVAYRDAVSGRLDLSGAAVDKAARVESLARAGQVLVSRETKVLVDGMHFHDWGRRELKGIGAHRIFEVLWDGKKPQEPAGQPFLKPERFKTSFVGRGSEIEQLTDLVRKQWLVTLIGMGGIGKTRLADEIAETVEPEFDGGVYWVELASKTGDPEQLVEAEIRAAADVRPEVPLESFFANRKALLVLNNFETVLPAAALVGRLLRSCAGLRFLVTSQKPLNLPEEQLFPMPVMPPEEAFPLFRERARSKRPAWEPSADDRPVVEEILGLTDRIPLCIELAAAHVEDMALAEIHDGLRKTRLEILKGTALEERHASMRATLEWSYRLLAPVEKQLFAKLAVFAGGFFTDDVVSITQAPGLDPLLNSLRSASLVPADTSGERTRYKPLPTVQEFAREKLGEDQAALRGKHSRHFLGVLERADGLIRGKEQMEGFRRIEADLDNVRAGMDAAIAAAGHADVVRYSGAFHYFLYYKSRFQELLLRSKQGLEAAEALGDKQAITASQNNLGNAYWNLPAGDRGENLRKAIACYEAALRVYTERDFPADWAMTQNNLGIAYTDLGNLKEAVACFRAAIRGYTAAGFHAKAEEVRRGLETMGPE